MMPVARKARAALKIDVVVECELWAEDAGAAARRAVAEAAAMLSTPRSELAIVLTDDSAIRSLNRAWRGVDAATNVLSFPTPPGGGKPPRCCQHRARSLLSC
jgi:probable rRNA maturation factor